jgi:hypothetical protein
MLTQERSLPELTKDLAANLGDLMRNELRLARAEAADNARRLGDDALRIALGVALAAAAVTLALFALAFALGEVLPMWIAAISAAAEGALLAYLLINSGRKAIGRQSIGMPRIAQSVANDIESVKEQILP